MEKMKWPPETPAGKRRCKCGTLIDEFDEDGGRKFECSECQEEERMWYDWYGRQAEAVDHAIHTAIENGDY